MNYKSFCGGIFETNCYLFEAPEGWILFDAPEGACEWVRSLERRSETFAPDTWAYRSRPGCCQD